jgi:hypothetical protein
MVEANENRKLKLTKHQREEALARREAGEPLVEIAGATTSVTARSQGYPRQCHSKDARKKNSRHSEILFCAVTCSISEHISGFD